MRRAGNAGSDMVKEWRKSSSTDFFTGRSTRGISQEKCLVIAIQRNIPGNNLGEKVANCRDQPGSMFYSLCNYQSTFLEEFRADPMICAEFDVYTKTIKPPLHCKQPYKWVALFCAYHIMRTHIARRMGGHLGEFVFHRRMDNLIPMIIVRHWDYIMNQKDNLADLLEAGLFFCPADCQEGCQFKHSGLHFGLGGMTLQPPPLAPFRLRNYTNHEWRIINNNSRLDRHPLKSLLSETNYNVNWERGWTNITVDEVFDKVEIDMNPIRGWSVYVILAVIWPTATPSMDNLFRLWMQEENASFSIYVGCTTEESYRTSHFDPNSESPILRIMNDWTNAKAFLVEIQRGTTHEESFLLESSLIEVLKADIECAGREDSKVGYTLLNRNSEIVAMTGLNAAKIDSMSTFVANQTPFFRFRHDTRDGTKNPGYISGQYEISRMLPY